MAFGNQTFSFAASGVSDIFSGLGMQESAKGSRIAAALYGQSAGISRQNEQLEGFATKIKQTQEERQSLRTIGQQVADVAGAGFEESGSALDLLRDSASQAAIAKQLIGEQGAIQENTYEQQAVSYDAMQQAALAKAAADEKGAFGKFLGGGLAIAGSLATLFI